MCELETPAIVKARCAIGEFVVAEALRRREVLGFGWEVSTVGPSSYPDLHQAYLHSNLTKQPLPLNPQLTNDLSGVTKASPAETINPGHAALFWHDTNHVRLGLDFTPKDEDTLALWQLMQLQMAGFRPWGMEYRVMQADTAGQIECGRQLGRYPKDPARFTALTIRGGFAQALELERAS